MTPILHLGCSGRSFFSFVVASAALVMATLPAVAQPVEGRFVRHDVSIQPQIGGCGPVTTQVLTTPDAELPYSFTCSGRTISGSIGISVPAVPPAAEPAPAGDALNLAAPFSMEADVSITSTAPGDPEGEPYTAGIIAQILKGVVPACNKVDSQIQAPGETSTLSLSLPCSIDLLGRISETTLEGVFYSILTVGVTNSNGPTVQVAFLVTHVYDYTPDVNLTISPSVAPNVIREGYFSEPLPVTIKGANFQEGATIAVGDLFVQNVAFVDENTLTAELVGFTNLSEGARSVEVTNPDDTKFSAPNLFYVSSLVLGPLEVNQGVPMPCNPQGLECVAGHDTLLRAEITCNGSGCETGKDQTKGRLHVLRGGAPVAGSPFAASSGSIDVRQIGTQFTPTELRNLEDSLDFQLFGSNAPGEGDWEFVLEVDPRRPELLPPAAAEPDTNNHLIYRRSAQRFAESSSNGVHVALIFDVTTERWRPRFLPVAARLFDYMRAAFPVSPGGLRVDLITDHSTTYTTEEETLERLTSWFNAQKRLLSDPYTHVVFFSFGATGDPGFAHCGSNGTEFLCSAPVVVVRANIDDPDTTAAHELGHTFLLGETYTIDGNEARSKLNMPSQLCIDLGKGCPVEDFHVDLQRLERSVNLDPADPSYSTFVKLDIMGNSTRDRQWIDKRTWDYFYGIFNKGAPIGGKVRPFADGPNVSVTAILAADGSGRLGEVWSGTGAFDETVLPDGEYAIVLEDASRSPLATKTFPVDFLSLHSRQPRAEVPIAVTMAMPAGSEWISLQKNGVELASRQLSSNPPTVRVDSPNGGESLTGTTTIRWTGSDPDDDPLTYSVFYEPSPGARIPIALSVSASSLAWDTALAKGSTEARITVVANDGSQNASDSSDGTFDVAAGGPIVAIDDPEDGAAVPAGVPVTLRGGAYDFDDGILPDNSLHFSSSRDGDLGQGGLLTTVLSQGVHTITLTAADSLDNEGSDSITLTVFTPVETQRVIPAVGSTPGAGGSFFKTAMQLHNPFATSIVGRIVYHPAGTSGTPSDATLDYSLLPGETIQYTDLLPELSQNGLGSADLIATYGAPPLSVIRIFNDAGAAGTTGMTEDQIDPAKVLRGGDEAILILPPDAVRARFNVGIRTLGSGASFVPTLLDSDGNVKSVAGTQAYAPDFFAQFNVASLFPNVTFEGTDVMRIAVSSGSLVIYGATTDNITQDPALQFATVVSTGQTGESRVVPVVGSLEGSLESYFKTEAQLHNPLASTLSGRIDFRPQGSGTVAASLPFEILPSRSLYVADLLPAMGVASGIGTAEIVSTSSGGLPVAVIRIFNDAGAAGTTGMTEDPIDPVNALQPGETGVLIAPPDPGGARFNIGVRALDGGASLMITVRDADGITKATLAKSYGPNAFEQTSSSTFLGMTLAASDTIAITVNTGSAIVYGATTDNTTQDPSLQFAQKF